MDLDYLIRLLIGSAAFIFLAGFQALMPTAFFALLWYMQVVITKTATRRRIPPFKEVYGFWLIETALFVLLIGLVSTQAVSERIESLGGLIAYFFLPLFAATKFRALP